MRQYAEVITMDFGMCLVRVGDTPLPPESRFRLRKMQANIDRKFREIIADGVKDASFTNCDPKFASFAVAGALNSIARWYRADGEFGAAEIAEMFVGILMSGLEARDTSLPSRRRPHTARAHARRGEPNRRKTK